MNKPAAGEVVRRMCQGAYTITRQVIVKGKALSVVIACSLGKEQEDGR